MRAHYTRLFADSDGTARFENHDAELQLGFAVPPAQPLFSAQFLPAEGTLWLGVPAAWKGDEPHPAPRRMIFVTVQGEWQVTASDGETRRFPVGSVLLIEDTTGAGHSTKVISADRAIVFAVALSAEISH